MSGLGTLCSPQCSWNIIHCMTLACFCKLWAVGAPGLRKGWCAAGVGLYNAVFKTVPLKKMLMWAMLLGVGLGSTQLLLVSGYNRVLGLSDELFVLGDSVILTVLGQVSHCLCSRGSSSSRLSHAVFLLVYAAAGLSETPQPPALCCSLFASLRCKSCIYSKVP